MKYEVFIDDNFHYMDEEHRYAFGTYKDCASAIAACKKIVDECLELQDKATSAAELYHQYVTFGEDPFIRTEDKDCKFSAWDYARQRCDEIVG